MRDLRGLPNIGSTLASELSASGIATSAQLLNVGSLGAASRLEAQGFSVCGNKLYALEGAIRSVRWHDMPSEERVELWATFLDLRDAP
jgi:DNA transformation protein